MSLYHLHARAIEGPLGALRRDEVRAWHTDEVAEAEAWIHRQLAEGFTVWVYDHGHSARLIGASDWRLIGHYRPRADGAMPALTRHPAPDPRRRSDVRSRSAG